MDTPFQKITINMAKEAIKYHFMDIWVNKLTQKDILDNIDHLIEAYALDGSSTGGGQIIAHHNLHSLYLYHKTPKMRNFYQKASLTYIDGMSLIVLARLLGINLNKSNRCTLLDWIYPLLTLCSYKNYRVAIIGSKPQVVDKAYAKIKSKFQNANLLIHEGYFDTTTICQENLLVVKKIRDFKPHIIMVGMGMPKQENWILDNLHSLPNSVILNVGAILEYIGETVPTPPRYLGNLGLEWSYRLISEPKRLWKRYLIEPWCLIPRFVKEICTKASK